MTMRAIGRGLIVAAVAGLTATVATAQSKDITEGIKIDTSKPIEITSDALEVRRDDQIAIFQGKVDVVQDTLRLRSDRLTVRYAGGTDGQPGEITSLRADGGVIITSGRENAKGGWATYDVSSQTIELGGGVTLAQSETVIKGDSLTINLASGRSRMVGGDATGGRVRSIFTIPGRGAPSTGG